MFLITSRLVGPSAFGTVAIAIGLVELCRSLIVENVAANLIANSAADTRDFNAGFAWTMTGSVVVCIALVFAAPTIAPLFHTPALVTVLPQIALLLVCYGVSRLQEARMIKEMRFRMLALRTVIAALLGGGVGVLAARAGLGVTALVYQQWAGAVVSVVLLWGASDWRPQFRFSFSQFTALHRASLMLAPANLIYGLSVLADGLAVAIVAGPGAAGIYNLGKRVQVAMLVALSGALDRVSLATFSKLQKNQARLVAVFEQALAISMLAVFPLFFGVAAVAPELIDVVLGPAWLAAATPMALLLIGGAFAVATSYCDNVLLVLEQRRWIVALHVVFIFVLIGGLLLFGRFGPTFVAATSLAASIIRSLAAAFALGRAAPFSVGAYLRTIAAPTVLSLAMLMLIAGLRLAPDLATLTPLQRLLILVATGALFYSASALLLARRRVSAAFRAARAAL